MKITQLECDWKDNFTAKEINKAAKSVGGKGLLYDYAQMEVDSKVMFVSSHELTDAQLDKLWSVGDLYSGDVIWEGKTFDVIVDKIKHYVEECIKEDEDK